MPSTFDVEWVGFAAATLTTVAFVPQVVRTWQMGGRELSWSMLGLFGTGVSLWLAYGLVRPSWPLIVANGLTLIQVAAMAAVKFTAAKRHTP
jgi:MtN3 and saliva related transmembrane protein